MSDERSQIEEAIVALEAQRELLGDAVVDTAMTPLRAKGIGGNAPWELGAGGRFLRRGTGSQPGQRRTREVGALSLWLRPDREAEG